MVIYNSTSQDWYNVSAVGYSEQGTSMYGVVQFVPSFGPAGLLFVLGGEVSGPGTYNGGPLLSFDSVSIYDPVAQSWQQQTASGYKPPPCRDACVVGLQGDSDTYEVSSLSLVLSLKLSLQLNICLQIFMFGGQSNDFQTTLSLGTVFVLSLPAFNWQRATSIPQYGRFLHSCNIVGNRQMLVIGGVVQTTSDYNANKNNSYVSSLDPWNQGLGVFDLSDMEWKEAYNASAASYVTPAVVRSWYAQHGRYPQFSSTTVQSWFTGKGKSGPH